MQGDPENAAKENRIAGEIYERLAAQDPDNAEWQGSWHSATSRAATR